LVEGKKSIKEDEKEATTKGGEAEEDLNEEDIVIKVNNICYCRQYNGNKTIIVFFFLGRGKTEI
jgi:hypothetical protein